MSARSCSTKAPPVDKKRAKHLPPRPRRAGVIPASDPHWLSSVLGAALKCDPQPSASAFSDQTTAARRLSTAEPFRD